MSEKNAPYLVYTNDENFVLNKEDINSGGGSGGNSGVAVFEISFGAGGITANFTYNELNDAVSNNKFVIAIAENMPSSPPGDTGYGIFYLYFVGTDGSTGYSASFISGANLTMPFTSSDPDVVMVYTT